MGKLTYEESVKWLRTQKEHEEIIKFCYFDEDNYEAATRFAQSEEFLEVINILKLKKPKKPLKILDLGCGNGIASFAFATLGHEVFAIDPDLSNDVGLSATKRLSKKLKEGSISTVNSFAENLPFPDNTFDIVYERQALHHFTSLNLGLKEVYRVLKANGKFLATREHVISNESQLNKFLEDHLLHKMHGSENAYPLKTYQMTFRACGFKIKKCFGQYDTVINHFPTSNFDLQQRLRQSLKSRFGSQFGHLLGKLPFTIQLYRKFLSFRSNEPGRLYSFLSTKQ